MNITKEEAHAIAVDVARELTRTCRDEVDLELQALRKADKDNEWTEERAKKIAETAADLAVQKITNNFYMGVGKKTIATIGALVVGAVFFMRDWLKAMIGMK